MKAVRITPPKERKYLHSLICQDAICSTGLIVSNDDALAVNLNTTQDILWPLLTSQKQNPQDGRHTARGATYQAIRPKSGGLRSSLR